MVNNNVSALFRQAALRFPQHPAVEEKGRSINYATLDKISSGFENRLRHLAGNGMAGKQVIGVHLPSSVELVTTVLSIMKAGAIYLPLDPALPGKALLRMLGHSTPQGIVTDLAHLEQTKGLLDQSEAHEAWIAVHESDRRITIWKKKIGGWAGEKEIPEESIAGPIGDRNAPGDEAYIFYTSGTTGDPKAILGSASSLAHFIQWEIQEFGIDNQVKVSQLTGIGFDASLRDIFLPLCAGGTLCIPSSEIRQNMILLADWLKTSGVTLIHCVPSLFRLLVKELPDIGQAPTSFPTLQYVLMSGEALYGRDIRLCKDRLGSQVLPVNFYGATETTMIRLFHRIAETPQDDAMLLPAGKPIADTAVAIISGNRRCRIGEIGEIYIKTPYWSKGYYKNEKETNRVFVQNPLIEDRKDIVYRTGDLGRYLKDNLVQVLSRTDDQVKVNGVRVLLSDIEQTILHIPGIEAVIVLAEKSSSFQTNLICYYISSAGLTPAGLKEMLSGTIGSAVMPAWFIPMEQFPVGPNGKYDRKKLPQPAAMQPEEDFEAPLTATEIKMESLWRELLQTRRLSRTTSFFVAGGTSLKAIQLVSRIFKTWQVNIRIPDIFHYPVLRDLSAVVDTAAKAESMKIERLGQQADYAVSFAQRRLWLIHQLEEELTAYHMQEAFLLRGQPDRTALETALIRLSDRHAILRTHFTENDGDIRQVVTPPVKVFPITCIDLGETVSEQDARRQVDEYMASAVLPLHRSPLMDISLFRTGKEQYVLLLLIHHIIADGWSVQVLIREFVAFYNAAVRQEPYDLPALPVQYADYAAWQMKQLDNGSIGSHSAFWNNLFKGPIPVLQLPTDFPRPAIKTYNGNVVSDTIDIHLAGRLEELALLHNASLFMVLQTAVLALLYQYTRQNDLVIGTPVAGRHHVDLEGQIGCYVNTIALRTSFSGEETFASLLEKVRSNTLEAFDHQVYPFDLLVDEVMKTRDASRSPLFDVMLVLQDTVEQALPRIEGLEVSEYNTGATISKFDLSFNFSTFEGGVFTEIVYNDSLFLENSARGMLSDLLRLIASIPEAGTSSLDAIVEQGNYVAAKTSPVDQGAAPAQDAAVYIAPRNPAEKLVADIIRSIAGEGQLSVTANLFANGFNSLKAMKVASRILRETGIRLNLVKIFSRPTIEGLAAELKAAAAGNDTIISPEDTKEEVII